MISYFVKKLYGRWHPVSWTIFSTTHTHTHYILLYVIKWLQHSLNNSRHNSFLMHTNIHYRFSTAPCTAFHIQDNPIIWHAHNQCAIAAVYTAKKFCLTCYHALNSNLGNTLTSSFLRTTWTVTFTMHQNIQLLTIWLQDYTQNQIHSVVENNCA